MKTVTLPEFLTKRQIAKAAALYKIHGHDAVTQIQTQVIDPNMPAINEKLGQENDARYLAFMVVHVLSQLSKRKDN